MEANELSQKIGLILRRLRRERGWTLDDMAQVTGVSKPMIGQIERGETNPTVVTLWKITSGLNLPFSVFLQDFEPPLVQLVPQRSQAIVKDDGGAYIVRNLVAIRHPHSSDLFEILLRANASHSSEPHGPSVNEAIWVHQGELCLSIEREEYVLNTGDSVQFVADTPHAYQNRSSTDCLFVVMLVYGNQGVSPRTP